MTVISAIIKDAYRENNSVPLGQEPSSDQITEALTRLSSLIAGVYGYDVGERLSDWMVGHANQDDPDLSWNEMYWKYPIQNSRILLNHTTAQSIYFPQVPDNGARMMIIDVNGVLDTLPVTIYGNGRLIESATSQLLNVAGTVRSWFFDADSAEWKRIDDLTVNSELPFPPEFDDYFIIKLAGRLSPRYGRSLSDLTLARLADQQAQLEARYRQTRPMPVPGALRRLAGPDNRGYDVEGGRRGRWGWMR